MTREHQTYLAEGIQLISDAVTILNNEIRANGEIKPNNKTIWRQTLNVWTNQDWAKITAVLIELNEHQSNLFRSYHERNLMETETILKKQWMVHPRVMDTKAYKNTAWKMLHTVREVWCEVNGIDLPNDDASKVSTNKADIFKW